MAVTTHKKMHEMFPKKKKMFSFLELHFLMVCGGCVSH